MDQILHQTSDSRNSIPPPEPLDNQSKLDKEVQNSIEKQGSSENQIPVGISDYVKHGSSRSQLQEWHRIESGGRQDTNQTNQTNQSTRKVVLSKGSSRHDMPLDSHVRGIKGTVKIRANHNLKSRAANNYESNPLTSTSEGNLHQIYQTIFGDAQTRDQAIGGILKNKDGTLNRESLEEHDLVTRKSLQSGDAFNLQLKNYSLLGNKDRTLESSPAKPSLSNFGHRKRHKRSKRKDRHPTVQFDLVQSEEPSLEQVYDGEKIWQAKKYYAVPPLHLQTVGQTPEQAFQKVRMKSAIVGASKKKAETLSKSQTSIPSSDAHDQLQTQVSGAGPESARIRSSQFGSSKEALTQRIMAGFPGSVLGDDGIIYRGNRKPIEHQSKATESRRKIAKGNPDHKEVSVRLSLRSKLLGTDRLIRDGRTISGKGLYQPLTHRRSQQSLDFEERLLRDFELKKQSKKEIASEAAADEEKKLPLNSDLPEDKNEDSFSLSSDDDQPRQGPAKNDPPYASGEFVTAMNSGEKPPDQTASNFKAADSTPDTTNPVVHSSAVQIFKRNLNESQQTAVRKMPSNLIKSQSGSLGPDAEPSEDIRVGQPLQSSQTIQPPQASNKFYFSRGAQPLEHVFGSLSSMGGLERTQPLVVNINTNNFNYPAVSERRRESFLSQPSGRSARVPSEGFVRQKTFNTAYGGQAAGYKIGVQDAHKGRFIYKNKSPTKQASRVQHALSLKSEATKSKPAMAFGELAANMPSDLWAEMQLRNMFEKEDEAQQERNKGEIFISKLSKKERFTEFNQNLMNINIYKESADMMADFKTGSGTVSVEPLSRRGTKKSSVNLQDLIASLKLKQSKEQDHEREDTLEAFGGEEMTARTQDEVLQVMGGLMQKKSLTDDEQRVFNRYFTELQNSIIENMSMFEDSLKLKLQMNVDLVNQDTVIWKQHAEAYKKDLKDQIGDMTLIRSQEDLLPPYIQKQDQGLKNLIEKLQRIVVRLQIEPFHQAPSKAVQSRDDMIDNLFFVKEQQQKQNEDLWEVVECLRKVMQRQSMAWLAHSKGNPLSGKEPGFKKTKQGGIHFDRKLTPAQQKEEAQRNRESELYEQFKTNQVMSLTSLYLVAVLNKYMEMQKLSQHRQKILNQAQYKAYRDEVNIKFDDLKKIHELAIERADTKINDLTRKLDYAHKEMKRLNLVIKEKDDDIKLLVSGGDDVRKMKDLFKELDENLTQMENDSLAKHQNCQMVKSLITSIEDEEAKRAVAMTQDLTAFKQKTTKKGRRTLNRTSSSYHEESNYSFNKEKAMQAMGTSPESMKAKKKVAPKWSTIAKKTATQPPAQKQLAIPPQEVKSPTLQLPSPIQTPQTPSRRESRPRIPSAIMKDTEDIKEELSEEEEDSSSLGAEESKALETSQLPSPSSQQLSQAPPVGKFDKFSQKQLCPGCMKKLTIEANCGKVTLALTNDKNPALRRKSTMMPNLVSFNRQDSISSGKTPLSRKKTIGSVKKLAEDDDKTKETPEGSPSMMGAKRRKSGKFGLKLKEQSAATKSESFEEATKKHTNSSPKTALISEGRKVDRGVQKSSRQSVPKKFVEDGSSKEEDHDRSLIRDNKYSQSVQASPNNFPKSGQQIIHFLDQPKKQEGQAVPNQDIITPPQFVQFEDRQELSSPVSSVSSTMETATLSLPDSALVRLLEVAMEEMVLFQCIQKRKQPLPLESSEEPTFNQYFKKFLQTQYGLPQLADAYYRQVRKRVKLFAKEKLSLSPLPNKYAIILNQLLESKKLQYFPVTPAESEVTGRRAIQLQKDSVEETTRKSIRTEISFMQKPGQMVLDQPITNPQSQRVAMYAMILFNDARSMSVSFTNQVINQKRVLSPRKSVSLVKQSTIGAVMSKGGEECRIFDLMDMITKPQPLNSLTIQIIDNLKPADFDYLLDHELEDAYLKYAAMKVTDKLQKFFNYDAEAFFDFLLQGLKVKNELSLLKLLTLLAEKLKIFFSVQEQLALRNGLFPEHRSETFEESRVRMVSLQSHLPPSQSTVSFDQLAFLPEDVFSESMGSCMVRKSDFCEFILSQYKLFKDQLYFKTTVAFSEYDQLRAKGGLNCEQFHRLVTQDLKVNFHLSFLGHPTSGYIQADMIEVEDFFTLSVQMLEVDNSLKKENLASLPTVLDLVLERNLELVPFNRFIVNKHAMQVSRIVNK